MNKHAYLIIAHGNWNVLKILISLLDDERNDIYLHIDLKSKEFPFDEIKVNKSKLYFLPSQKIFWADYSMIECEMRLFETAYKKYRYSYFHLLSGVDLPIKPIEEVYNFFENSGKNFIGIVPKEVYYSVRRVKYYHPLLSNKYYRGSKVLKGIDRILEYCQKAIGVNRLRNKKISIIDGWQWLSITNSFCEYALSKREEIRSVFQNTISCDELVFQTLIYNSPFYKTLYDKNDLKNGSMRYIDWNRGKPYTWGTQDFEELINSPYMFARKFDENVDMQIVKMIYDKITLRKNNENDK